jgi:hypothetical protein
MSNVYIAIYDNKHDIEHSVHETKEGAESWLAKEARHTLKRWGNDYISYASWSDSQLVSAWGDLTGESQFMRVLRRKVKP